MTEKRETAHTSGEHKLELERTASDPPIVSKKSPSGTPTSEPDIDAEKLLKAWSAMTNVNKELIRVVEKNEEDNATTRRSHTKTRWTVVLACLIMLLGTGVHTLQIRQMSLRTADEIATSKKQAVENHRIIKDVGHDVKETLQAVRATAEAVGAKLEADTTNDPEVVEEAEQKALEAQVEALDAEAKVADDPTKKAEAGRKLQVVKEKARLRTIRVESSPIDSGSFSKKPPLIRRQAAPQFQMEPRKVAAPIKQAAPAPDK